MNDPESWTPPPRQSGKAIPDDAQRVFDTVTGPNLRLSDNLSQLASICGGALLCALIGAIWAWKTSNPPVIGAVLGGFAGVVLSLFLSGAILGFVRFIRAVKQR
jgi:hypothetical protein